MSLEVPIQVAKQNLDDLLEQIHLGETITLLGPQGEPEALIVSLRPTHAVRIDSTADWLEQWEDLAHEVGRAWPSDKSAVEVIAEMRR